MTVAIYAGSFDPVTSGHLDIARRASTLFDKLYVAVYDTPVNKRPLFSTDQRVELFRDAVQDLKNVEVISYTGLTVDLAKRVGAQALVRGLRATSDFEAEFSMALMNKKIAPDLETVCLVTKVEHQFLSSSLVKEVVSLGGPAAGLVPPGVEQQLRDALQRRQQQA
ncbi:MAG TPA: pantetheine-phosphate adenylyltransferase [Dehalococcoidia bacterium]|nr:pantetheine-phosphate adenylyltransferase [Dehalococcoidia bacterium]